MDSKKTLVLGASENEERYSNRCMKKLKLFGHEVVALGLRAGEVDGIKIETEKIPFENVDTVTMNMGEKNQRGYEDYVLSLNPKRIIFNPGAENQNLFSVSEKKGIECIDACTLVMLSTGQF